MLVEVDEEDAHSKFNGMVPLILEILLFSLSDLFTQCFLCKIALNVFLHQLQVKNIQLMYMYV